MYEYFYNLQILTQENDALLLSLLFLAVVPRKILPLEEQKIKGSHSHAAVCEVEHRTEEDHFLRRPDDREIEHVHHLSEHEWSIIPDDAIEKAINDIAYRSGRNEGKSHQHSCRSILLLEKRRYPPYQGAAKTDAEKREKELAHIAPEGHSEGHSFILDKAQSAPFSNKIYLLAKKHIGLDQDFDDLINDDQQNSQQC